MAEVAETIRLGVNSTSPGCAVAQRVVLENAEIHESSVTNEYLNLSFYDKPQPRGEQRMVNFCESERYLMKKLRERCHSEEYYYRIQKQYKFHAVIDLNGPEVVPANRCQRSRHRTDVRSERTSCWRVRPLFG